MGNREPERRNRWAGVGTGAWRKVQRGQTHGPPSNSDNNNNTNNERRKIWMFGDSIMSVVGGKIHSVTNGEYRIMD